VWRIKALNEAGGWKDRTTVEDMDLAVRATLEGWKFLYLCNLEVPISKLSSLYMLCLHTYNDTLILFVCMLFLIYDL